MSDIHKIEFGRVGYAVRRLEERRRQYLVNAECNVEKANETLESAVTVSGEFLRTCQNVTGNDCAIHSSAPTIQLKDEAVIEATMVVDTDNSKEVEPPYVLVHVLSPEGENCSAPLRADYDQAVFSFTDWEEQYLASRGQH